MHVAMLVLVCVLLLCSAAATKYVSGGFTVTRRSGACLQANGVRLCNKSIRTTPRLSIFIIMILMLQPENRHENVTYHVI